MNIDHADTARPLEPRERLWVHHYLQCMNAQDAAIAAGWTPQSAGVTGFRLKNDPVIREHIEKALNKQAMSAGEVIARLTSQASADIGDAFDIDESGYPRLNISKLKKLGKMHLIKKLKYDSNGMPEVEMYDAQNALQLLGKVHALFTERHVIDQNIHVNVQVRATMTAAMADPGRLAALMAAAENLIDVAPVQVAGDGVATPLRAELETGGDIIGGHGIG